MHALILAAALASFSNYQDREREAWEKAQDARIAAFAKEQAPLPEVRFPRGTRKMYEKPVPLSDNAKRMIKEICDALQAR